VEYQPPSTAPDAGSVLKFVVPRVWKSKWLIAATAVLAAAVTFGLMASSKIEIWSGRATLTVGLAPASDFIAGKSRPRLAPIETPRRTIARLSDPAFKEMIVKRAVFEPAAASVSRSMVASSLRGILLDKERDVAVELSAGSAADVQSAFRAIAAEIGASHGEILDRQIQMLQSRIDTDKASIAEIEEVINKLSDRILKLMPPLRTNGSQPSLAIPLLATTISEWTELRSQVRNDTILKQLCEPTVLRVEPDNLVVAHRSIDRLRASLLAGAGMLLAMIILTIVVSPPGRADGRLDRIDLTER
jgi:hypothetical protein